MQQVRLSLLAQGFAGPNTDGYLHAALLSRTGLTAKVTATVMACLRGWLTPHGHGIGSQHEVVRDGKLLQVVRIHLGQLRAVHGPVLRAELLLCTGTAHVSTLTLSLLLRWNGSASGLLSLLLLGGLQGCK